MPLSRFHRALTGGFILLFFLMNAGYTVALYECRMSGHLESAPCCAMTAHRPIQSGGRLNAAESTGIRAVPLPCTSLHIVGGLKLHPSTLDNERVVKSVHVEAVYLGQSLVAATPDLPRNFLTLPAHSSGPPAAVDTYLLNSTFLI